MDRRKFFSVLGATLLAPITITIAGCSKDLYTKNTRKRRKLRKKLERKLRRYNRKHPNLSGEGMWQQLAKHKEFRELTDPVEIDYVNSVVRDFTK